MPASSMSFTESSALIHWGGGVVVGVDADDAAVFGKLFVRVEVDGVFGVV